MSGIDDGLDARPFDKGDRLFNTGNSERNTIGIVTKVIDDEHCEVLWFGANGYVFTGTIKRDGSVSYGPLPGHPDDRIVRVRLSVHLLGESE